TICKSVSVTVNTRSTDPTSASSNAALNEYCIGSGTVTLTVAGGSLGTNGVWKWYLDGGSCGAGTLVGTGASITVTPPAVPGPHTYYVRAEGICNTTNCASIVITVKAPSVAATSASASVTTLCAGDPSQLSVNGGSL